MSVFFFFFIFILLKTRSSHSSYHSQNETNIHTYAKFQCKSFAAVLCCCYWNTLMHINTCEPYSRTRVFNIIIRISLSSSCGWKREKKKKMIFRNNLWVNHFPGRRPRKKCAKNFMCVWLKWIKIKKKKQKPISNEWGFFILIRDRRCVYEWNAHVDVIEVLLFILFFFMSSQRTAIAYTYILCICTYMEWLYWIHSTTRKKKKNEQKKKNKSIPKSYWQNEKLCKWEVYFSHVSYSSFYISIFVRTLNEQHKRKN